MCFLMKTKEGYEFIKTPIMLNKELWELSGHWFNYREICIHQKLMKKNLLLNL